ncbi:MAG: amidohydrolase [Actinobacteria bacterium]|nr:MAG: amidohydrolase [Actinomycetota bacterium]
MREWRHRLHQNPELSFAVNTTAATVSGLLTQFGVDEVHTEIGTSGVVGVIRRGSKARAIGLRADMDALPIQEIGDRSHRSQVEGVFHGCGHDGHTAMLLGAARRLSQSASFDGTAVLIFQPDEENGRGAQAMIDDGLFDRFPMSAIYGLHNKPGVPTGQFATRVGPMMSSEDLFEIRIRGSGGHASMPERHIDPIVIAAEIIQALQTIVSRSVAATETAVVSVTEVLTDGARNIIPSSVVIKGDCRTFSSDVQETVELRMRRLVDGICAAHGAAAEVDYRNEFMPLVNTANEVAAAARAAGQVVGAEYVNTDCVPITASEDFARYLRYTPGCFLDIGNGTDGSCGKSLHNPSYDFNDEILTVGTDFWVQLIEQELPESTL